MKKQSKIVLGVVLILVVGIIAMSLIFPSAFKGITSGTFGKADKFRKSQMTEQDIKLRSEFTSDTAQLKSMISGLIYFAAFTTDLTNKIDSCVTIYQQKGFNDKQEGYKNLLLVKDFSDFIKNNNKTLETTVVMLAGFYEKKSDESLDVEKNLREFGNYVKNLNEKDSLLSVALLSMDNFMLSNKSLKSRKDEFVQLKSIRDRLLIKGIQTAGLLQDKPMALNLLKITMGSQEIFKNALGYGLEALGEFNSQQQIGSNWEFILANGDLKAIDAAQISAMGSQQSNKAVSSSSKDLSSKLIGVLYNASNLSFEPILLNSAELKLFAHVSSNGMSYMIRSQEGNAISSSSILKSGLECVALRSASGINVVEPALKVQNIIGSSQIKAIMGSAQMASFLGMNGGLGNMQFSAGFTGFSTLSSQELVQGLFK